MGMKITSYAGGPRRLGACPSNTKNASRERRNGGKRCSEGCFFPALPALLGGQAHYRDGLLADARELLRDGVELRPQRFVGVQVLGLEELLELRHDAAQELAPEA